MTQEHDSRGPGPGVPTPPQVPAQHAPGGHVPPSQVPAQPQAHAQAPMPAPQQGPPQAGPDLHAPDQQAPAHVGRAERPSPFSPPGVDFHPVDPRLVKVRVLTSLIVLGPLILISAVLALIVGWGFWIGTGVCVALLVWLLWLIPRQVRAMGYCEAADDLLFRKGILWRSLVAVPYGRMQYIDVQAGPLDRAFGIATVTLSTASAQTDAKIPGLPADEAARLREVLTSRGEARLAGL